MWFVENGHFLNFRFCDVHLLQVSLIHMGCKKCIRKKKKKIFFPFFFVFFVWVVYCFWQEWWNLVLFFIFCSFDPFSVASWFIHNPIYIWLDTVWFIDGWYINWRRKGTDEQFLPLNVYIGTLGCTKWLATRPFRFYWHAKVSNWLFAELAYYWGANPFQIPWIGRCDWL